MFVPVLPSMQRNVNTLFGVMQWKYVCPLDLNKQTVEPWFTQWGSFVYHAWWGKGWAGFSSILVGK